MLDLPFTRIYHSRLGAGKIPLGSGTNTGGNRVRKLRRVAVLGLATAVAAIGLAACGGGSSSSSSSGKEGGEINGTLTSFPDYLDPQLSYTLEGWEGLWNVYVPLLTYQHGNGDETAKVVPGLAEALPTISPDGKTYTMTLRKGMKYSDGSASARPGTTLAVSSPLPC